MNIPIGFSTKAWLLGTTAGLIFSQPVLLLAEDASKSSRAGDARAAASTQATDYQDSPTGIVRTGFLDEILPGQKGEETGEAGRSQSPNKRQEPRRLPQTGNLRRISPWGSLPKGQQSRLRTQPAIRQTADTRNRQQRAAQSGGRSEIQRQLEQLYRRDGRQMPSSRLQRPTGSSNQQQTQIRSGVQQRSRQHQSRPQKRKKPNLLQRIFPFLKKDSQSQQVPEHRPGRQSVDLQQQRLQRPQAPNPRQRPMPPNQQRRQAISNPQQRRDVSNPQRRQTISNPPSSNSSNGPDSEPRKLPQLFLDGPPRNASSENTASGNDEVQLPVSPKERKEEKGPAFGDELLNDAFYGSSNQSSEQEDVEQEKQPQPKITEKNQQQPQEKSQNDFPNPFPEGSESEADGQGSPFSGLKLEEEKPVITPNQNLVDDDEEKEPNNLPPAPFPKDNDESESEKLPTFNFADKEKSADQEENDLSEETSDPEEQKVVESETDEKAQSEEEAEEEAEEEETVAEKDLSKDVEKARKKLIAARANMTGFKGFCPVELRDEQNLVNAVPKFSATYHSRTYTFSSAEAKAKFEKKPAKYAPVARGNDVVLLLDNDSEFEGSLDHAVWYRDRLYLFSSRETLETFTASPKKYLADKLELTHNGPIIQPASGTE